MNRLRWLGLLLSATLAAIVARMVIDGPELVAGLAGVVSVRYYSIRPFV